MHIEILTLKNCGQNIMYNSTVKKLHIELTNRCNAGCPACVRTGVFAGGLDDHMINAGFHDLSLDDIKRIHSGLPDLNAVHLCGNLGDPAVCPEFKEIVQYFTSNDIFVSVSTNGAPRTPQYWVEMVHPKLYIQWHIDGDEDTNHIYRVGTNYHKIIANAKAFNEAGGRSKWVFIPFEHNEHVIEKCREEAKKNGFVSFDVKKSYRINTPQGVNERGKKSGVVLNHPKNPDLNNPFIYDKSVVREVECRVVHKEEMYVACDGDVYPCCWWGIHYWYYKYDAKVRDYTVERFNYLVDFDLNIHTTDIQSIIDGYETKREILELIWEEKRFHICNRNCGSKKWLDRMIKGKLVE